jgi:poly(A) polymerase
MEEEIASLYHEVAAAYRQTIKPVLAKRLLTGNDLIEIFGLQPGPEFRKIFNNLEDGQVEGEVRDREQALVWVKDYLKSHK